MDGYFATSKKPHNHGTCIAKSVQRTFSYKAILYFDCSTLILCIDLICMIMVDGVS